MTGQPTLMPPAAVDQAMVLKRKGFGNWSEADLDTFARLCQDWPHVRDLILPGPPVGHEIP